MKDFVVVYADDDWNTKCLDVKAEGLAEAMKLPEVKKMLRPFGYPVFGVFESSMAPEILATMARHTSRELRSRLKMLGGND